MTTFSFGGCGWLLSYGLGFAKSSQLLLRETLWFREAHFAGASGGSLVAAVLASGVPAETVQQYVWEAARRLEVLPFKSFRLRVGPELSEGMDKFFPSDAHVRVRDRLHISLTRLEHFIPRNRLISQFSSREHLMDTLRTSCHIPGYTASSLKCLWQEGAWYFDGGLTDNAPIITPHTYRVSPFPHPNSYDVTPYYPHPCSASLTFAMNDSSLTSSNAFTGQPLHTPSPSEFPSSPPVDCSKGEASVDQPPATPNSFDLTTVQLLRHAAWPTARALERIYQKGEEDGTAFIKWRTLK